MPINSNCSYYLVPFYFSEDRDRLQNILRNYGVGTNVSYKNPIHLMKAYEDLGYKNNDLPKTEVLKKLVIDKVIMRNLRNFIIIS